MSKKHTPTPWHIATGYTQVKSEILDKEDFLVAECFDRHKGNAEFIVRACNSYDALVKALSNILKYKYRIDNKDWSEFKEAEKVLTELTK